MSGADIKIGLSTSVTTPEVVTTVKKEFPKSAPCDWHVEPTKEGIIATLGGYTYKGSVKDFNALFRGD